MTTMYTTQTYKIKVGIISIVKKTAEPIET